jgi:hypothetical protein
LRRCDAVGANEEAEYEVEWGERATADPEAE